jgi:hypothetical protein
MTVSPDWFFSTLAQASAASIGFLLAFIAAIYSTRKSRVNDRTLRLLEHLSDTESEFDPLLDAMSRHISATAGIPVEGNVISEMKEINLNQEEIQEMAEGFDKPNTMVFYANLERAKKLMNLLVGPQPNNKKADQLAKLNETTNAMVENVGMAKNAMVLYSEISEEEDIPDDYAREDIFGSIPEIQNWLESEYSSEQATTLAGWNEVLRNYRHQTVRGGQFAQNTDLVVDFKEFEIVLTSVKRLFVIGVILPMLFLLYDFPSWWVSISGLWLTALELAFVVVIGFLSWRLFSTVNQLIKLGDNLD